MTKLKTFARSAGCAVLALLPAAAYAAGASSPVGWVSKQFGDDMAGCGAAASPCKTFQYAHDNIVAAGGAIMVRDPGGYGPLVIRKAISVINDGAGVASISVAAGDAISIEAGASDVVLIKGLTILGQGSARAGVSIKTAGVTTMDRCTVLNFSEGFEVKAGQYVINESLIMNSAQDDAIIRTSSPGVIQHSLLSNANSGITMGSPELKLEDDDIINTSVAILNYDAPITISNTSLNFNANVDIANYSFVANNTKTALSKSILLSPKVLGRLSTGVDNIINADASKEFWQPLQFK